MTNFAKWEVQCHAGFLISTVQEKASVCIYSEVIFQLSFTLESPFPPLTSNDTKNITNLQQRCQKFSQDGENTFEGNCTRNMIIITDVFFPSFDLI